MKHRVLNVGSFIQMNDAQVADLPFLDTENLENGYQFSDGVLETAVDTHFGMWLLLSIYIANFWRPSKQYLFLGPPTAISQLPTERH